MNQKRPQDITLSCQIGQAIQTLRLSYFIKLIFVLKNDVNFEKRQEKTPHGVNHEVL